MTIVAGVRIALKLGQVPRVEPGKVAIPVWNVQDIRPNESFEVAILNKMKEPIDKPPVKRRNVHMKTKVLSDPE